jgi:hypothetical protein
MDGLWIAGVYFTGDMVKSRRMVEEAIKMDGGMWNRLRSWGRIGG